MDDTRVPEYLRRRHEGDEKWARDFKAAVLLESDYWTVVLSPEQYYLGRSIVLLKRECPSLSELSGEEWDDMHSLIKRFETGVRDAFGAEVFNWCCLMNNAFREDPPHPFVHFHVRPRYRNPFEIGGEIFTDEHFGSHYELARRESRNVSPEVLQEILRSLRQTFHQ